MWTAQTTLRTQEEEEEDTAKMRVYFIVSFLVNDRSYFQSKGHLLSAFFLSIFTGRILKYRLNDCV